MVTTNRTGVTTYDTPTDREVVITRTFAASRPLVFAAWTDCRHVRHWMLGPEGWTMPECLIELRPGGRMRYLWRKADGTQMEITGECKEVAPPERLVSTESWGGDWPETLNTMVLTEQAGKTTVALTIRYAGKDARDQALQSGMKEGLELSYQRLDSYLTQVA